ncbi:hypothetical protein HZF08_34505 [Paenibacillus sp. CGMCC 1.16610]|uniref:DUF2577 domain-containing protein n=1 Tax=Paenibacillus anseongense TaxID=2682845 RepID=A0ABW9U1B5_9BACL|nr:MULTISPECIES: hypothetical protein [Paenibacillus]MBA2943385.1 hypothetical protein [Paenibacillus sp. CGMCC 1.16610]MVQ33882.1 hypothetical protein [Paenibacillus anseongense]
MNPYKKLAAALDNRMSVHASSAVAGMPAELGTITAGGLKLDSFKHEISDYYVADWMTKLFLPSFTISGTVTGLTSGNVPVTGQGRFAFSESEVEEVRIAFQSGLKVGDRVLAIPVNDGNDAVILCKVVK